MSVSPDNLRLRRMRRERLSLLSDWYGPEFAATEIGGHLSRPRSLSSGIRSVMAQLETPEARALRRLREMWPTVVGAWLANMTLPDSWRDGTLVLAVRHSALLRELQQSLELIRDTVNDKLPEVPCREVRLNISGGGASR